MVKLRINIYFMDKIPLVGNLLNGCEIVERGHYPVDDFKGDIAMVLHETGVNPVLDVDVGKSEETIIHQVVGDSRALIIKNIGIEVLSSFN